MANTGTAYAMLKVDLGFLGVPPEPVENYMQQLLDSARTELARDGVALDENDPADAGLVAMYAAWLYRKRDSGAGKPRMLREALNDRKVHGKVGAV